MDERTRTTDDDLTPGLPPSMRRTAPQPAVKARRYTATRIGIGLIIVVLLALGAYQIGRWVTAGKAPTGRVRRSMRRNPSALRRS